MTGNIVQFQPKPRPEKGDELPKDMAFCCPTCFASLWYLRADWLCECENGHSFQFITWDIKEKDL